MREQCESAPLKGNTSVRQSMGVGAGLYMVGEPLGGEGEGGSEAVVRGEVKGGGGGCGWARPRTGLRTACRMRGSVPSSTTRTHSAPQCSVTCASDAASKAEMKSPTLNGSQAADAGPAEAGAGEEEEENEEEEDGAALEAVDSALRASAMMAAATIALRNPTRRSAGGVRSDV